MSARGSLVFGAVSVALVSTGCREILGFEDAPPASECVYSFDCPSGKTCFGNQCVPDCGAGGCIDGGDSGTDVSVEDSADAYGDSANQPDVSNEIGSAPVVIDADAMDDSTPESEAGAEDVKADGNLTEADGDGEPGSGGDAEGGGCGPLGCHPCYSEDDPDAGGVDCPAVCSSTQGCIMPMSCRTLSDRCGPNLNCCRSLPVPGGAFARSSDVDTCTDTCGANCSARVSPFYLDVFEVTVGRFRKFVSAYPGSKPAVGQGKNPNDDSDTGWNADWDVNLPADATALRAQLLAPGTTPDMTWTDDFGPNETKPMNYVTWYMANAFCIWDGGRLPTEAEWNYAAAGGTLNRRYPWSVPSDDPLIDSFHAIFTANGTPPPTGPASVGSTLQGQGLWGQYDLVGNVGEWMRDTWSDCYVFPTLCRDCANLDPSPGPRATRGGSYFESADEVRVALRAIALGDINQLGQIGFRCARNP